MPASRRQFVIGAGAAGIALTAAALPQEGVTPEMFGAKGDGRTNDTDAFAALSAHINARGGGTVILRPVTYIVGKQSPSGKFAFSPSDILHFVRCKRSIVIHGNGATLRCAPRLRYGGFSRSGEALPEARSNLQLQSRAVPYLAMIYTEDCAGSVEISDLNLDGNLGQLQVGGRYGNGGWQAGGSGIRLNGNTGPERLSRIHSHHHAQDGIILTGAVDRIAATTVSDVVCEENGRVGFSVLGGRNHSIERSIFRRNGKGGMRSAPAAGVDIEAERPPIRNVAFSRCEFSDNSGFGIVAGSKTSSDLRFDNCKFVGTTNWAAWPDSPRMRFSNCLFVGAIIRAHGDADPANAAQFVNCTFTDDPSLSPTGEVFLGTARSKSIAVVPNNPNVTFSRCHFRLVRDGLLPLSGPDVIYADCDMAQRSASPSRPRGTYVGSNSIRGNADLRGSIIRGTVTLNGRQLS